MSSKKLHTIMLAAIGLLFIGLLAGTYGVNSLLSSESQKLVVLKAKSQALNQEKVRLKAAKADIEKYAELEKIAKAVVPEDKSQAQGVREIVNIAAANNIKLASVTFPASSLGTTPGAAGASATTPPPAANPATASLSQLEAVKNIPGVYQMVITVTGDPNQPVAYDKFISFLDALEHNRRTAQVSSIVLQPDSKNRNLLTFTLTLNQYIKP